MKLRNTINGYEFDAELSTEHAASSYGQPVLVDTDSGEAIDILSFAFAEVVEATDEEREQLATAGYVIRTEEAVGE